MSIRAVIIEDEENGLRNLKSKLSRHCPEVEIVGTCLTAEEGIRVIKTEKPDLVFLDVRLGPVNGFDMLLEIQHIDFHLIITTDYNTYGIDAVKANAIDYLLKPVNKDELVQSVKKVLRRRSADSNKPNLLAIPTSDGFKLVSLEEVIYIKGNNQRSSFFLFNGKIVDSPRLLGRVAAKLTPFGFHRIHRSYLVNLQYIESYSRSDGGYVIMSDGAQLRVSQDFDVSGYHHNLTLNN